MALSMHNNLLAVYPHILERLKGVAGIKAVKEVGELSELIAGIREKRKVAPLDGVAYVVYGGSQPDGQSKNGRQIKQTLYFSFVLCRTYRANSRSTLHETGAVLTAVQAAFSGWDAGADVAAGPFRQVPAPPIEYNDSFAFYPISFAVDVVTLA